MKKMLFVFLVTCVSVFGTCTTTTNGNWTAPIWTGCAGGGTTAPATTDSPVIANTVTINTSFTVVAISAASAGAKILTDGAAHTITLTTSSANGMQLAYGASPYVLDTSAGSNGNELTISCPNLNSSLWCVAKQWGPVVYGAAGINLVHAVVSTPGIAVYDQASSGSDTLIVDHVKCVGAYDCVYGAGALTLQVTYVTWTGGTGPYGIYLQYGNTTCTIHDFTVYDPAANAIAIRNLSAYTGATNTGCTNIYNIAASGDTGGSYYVSGVEGNGLSEPSAMTINNVLCKDYQSSTSSTAYCVAFVNGGASTINTVSNVASEDLFNAVYPSGYATVSNVWSEQIHSTNVQGALFSYGATGQIWHNNIVVTLPPSVEDIAFYPINNSSNNITATLYQNSSINNSSTKDYGYGLGEGTFGVGLVAPSLAYNNVSDGDYYGFQSGTASNVFSTSCTGGVGVCNNDVVNYTAASPYSRTPGDTNFQSGSTQHPNALYGDVSVSPWWYPEVLTRNIKKCDEYIGNLVPGTGSAEHVFQQLGNIFNNTNAAGYTISNVNACLRAGATPRNPALTTAGFGGTYIGHAQPNILAAGATM